MESSFRAARDGAQATLLHEGTLQPVSRIVSDILERVRPHAEAVEAGDALDDVRWLLGTGGGAARQRRAYARDGMPGLLRFLVTDTGAVAV